ncbi:hypothetical protein B0T12DRAFT_110682 [Alternaria alternata]|nr:hypothetical protein B0T12DRAFT_110682 [Alternaria alternata]
MTIYMHSADSFNPLAAHGSIQSSDYRVTTQSATLCLSNIRSCVEAFPLSSEWIFFTNKSIYKRCQTRFA